MLRALLWNNFIVETYKKRGKENLCLMLVHYVLQLAYYIEALNIVPFFVFVLLLNTFVAAYDDNNDDDDNEAKERKRQREKI